MRDEIDEYNERRQALRRRNFAIAGIVVCLILLAGIFLVGKFLSDTSSLSAMGEASEAEAPQEATIEPLPPLERYPMNVDSTPPGAAIIVNGIATGLETPATIDAVAEVPNTLVLIKDGYETLVHNAAADTDDVALKLVEYNETFDPERLKEEPKEGPVRGQLRVISRSPGGVFEGADVRLNGHAVSSPTPADIDVPANQLQHVSVRHVDHLDGVMFVQAIPHYKDTDRRDALVEMQKKRDNAYSAVAIRTFPRNARVYMDDEEITGSIITPVAMNRHFTIRAEAPGHEPYEQSFDAIVGTIDISIMLKQPVFPDGKISVEGGPEDATLYLVPQREGRESGLQIGRHGEASERTVESGPYLLRVAYGPHNQRGKTDLEIEVPENKHVRVVLAQQDDQIVIRSANVR